MHPHSQFTHSYITVHALAMFTVSVVGHLRLQCVQTIDRVLVMSVSQAYLEDFHRFCQTLGTTTAEVMGEILGVSCILFAIASIIG